MGIFARKPSAQTAAGGVAVEEHQGSSTGDKVRIIAPLLGVLIGIALLLYPVFATRHNDVLQQEKANSYQIQTRETPPEVVEKSLAQADQYNEDLRQGVILDPFIKDVAPDSEQYQAYLKQLAYIDQMGQVRVPAAQVNLPIYHGTFDDTLQKGIGHLFGSALPVGGESTHSVLTGHTGLPNATMFDNLTKVKEGDAMYLNVAGRQLKYIVNDIRVVEPSNVESLGKVEGKDLLTLITCTPYGVNSHRLLVTGERAPMDEVEAQEISTPPEVKAHWSWWMWVLLGGAIVSAILMAGAFIRLWLILRKEKEEKELEAAAAAHPENN